jgi:hypothetical protein
VALLTSAVRQAGGATVTSPLANREGHG